MPVRKWIPDEVHDVWCLHMHGAFFATRLHVWMQMFFYFYCSRCMMGSGWHRLHNHRKYSSLSCRQLARDTQFNNSVSVRPAGDGFMVLIIWFPICLCVQSCTESWLQSCSFISLIQVIGQRYWYWQWNKFILITVRK